MLFRSQVILGYHRNSAPYVNVPLDFGSATGFIEYPQGKGSYMNGAISGTGGVVFYQASTATTGAGLTLGGGSSHTWTGDTYILSQLAADENALPGRGRLGDLYVRGMLEVDNGTYNGLNGCGIIRRRDTPSTRSCQGRWRCWTNQRPRLRRLGLGLYRA